MQINFSKKSSKAGDGSDNKEWSFNFRLSLVPLLRLLLFKI